MLLKKFRGDRMLMLLTSLTILAIANNGWHYGLNMLHYWRRPAKYVTVRYSGIAISLNGLLIAGNVGALPVTDITGVLVDRSHNDWLLIGNYEPGQPDLSADAIATAIRACRDAMDAPGVDIRPAGAGLQQRVTYFSGVENSVVGEWFYTYDYWMKQAALAVDEPLPGIPSYWQRAVDRCERSQARGEPEMAKRSSRCWLVSKPVEARENGDVLLIDKAPLLVQAESVQGSDDPLAHDFAADLTAVLPRMPLSVPVTQIRSFTKLMSAFTWLPRKDPYYDLKGWKKWMFRHANTPSLVPGFMRTSDSATFTLRVSGGVEIRPELAETHCTEQETAPLYRSVLNNRPAGTPVIWRFTCTVSQPTL